MYRVEWDPLCIDQFDEFPASGIARDRLVNAVKATHLALSEDPISQSLHLSEGLFRFDLASLRIFFHLDASKRVVTVDWVQWIE
jgi:hypothetical protein